MTRDLYTEQVIAPGDRASELAKQVGFGSHRNCQAIKVLPMNPHKLRGAVGVVWREPLLQEMADYVVDAQDRMVSWRLVQDIQNDSAGGKPQFAALLGEQRPYFDMPWEHITMNADDIARNGGMACYMANEIMAKSITDQNYPFFEAMMDGLNRALAHSRLANITGEIAIMRNSITGFCDMNDPSQLLVTWGGTCVGLIRQSQMFDHNRIKPGMAIIGYLDPGYRCNGGTFLTNVISKTFGTQPHAVRELPRAVDFVRQLATPSKSYAVNVSRINGWNLNGSEGEKLVRIYGCAHITGGGLWNKLGEILPKGVGARLNNMPPPAQCLLEAQELSQDHEALKMSDWTAYSTFHGACGMFLVVHRDDADKAVSEAFADHIEASIVGETVASEDSEIVLDSRFMNGGILSSLKKLA